MIAPGTFETVACLYGNQSEDAKKLYLRNGWAIHSITRPEYETNGGGGGDKNLYITFVAGVDAKQVRGDWPNANKL